MLLLVREKMWRENLENKKRMICEIISKKRRKPGERENRVERIKTNAIIFALNFTEFYVRECKKRML